MQTEAAPADSAAVVTSPGTGLADYSTISSRLRASRSSFHGDHIAFAHLVEHPVQFWPVAVDSRNLFADNPFAYSLCGFRVISLLPFVCYLRPAITTAGFTRGINDVDQRK